LFSILVNIDVGNIVIVGELSGDLVYGQERITTFLQFHLLQEFEWRSVNKSSALTKKSRPWKNKFVLSQSLGGLIDVAL